MKVDYFFMRRAAELVAYGYAIRHDQLDIDTVDFLVKLPKGGANDQIRAVAAEALHVSKSSLDFGHSMTEDELDGAFRAAYRLFDGLERS